MCTRVVSIYNNAFTESKNNKIKVIIHLGAFEFFFYFSIAQVTCFTKWYLFKIIM